MSDPSKQSDNDLMRRVQAGDAESFSELAARYRGALLRVAWSRLGRAEWADEAVQETLLSAFRSRDRFDPERSFRTWLWTILLNQCRDSATQRARQRQVACWSDQPEATPISAAVACDQPSPLSCLLAQERVDLLERMLGLISPSQADALRLRFFAGMKFQEIADTMNCSLLTAKNRVKWGLLRLSRLTGDARAGVWDDRSDDTSMDAPNPAGGGKP